jgi:RoxA-like, cytochrome c-like
MNQEAYDRLARRYKWVTWLGIFLNALFIIPLLFFPTPFLALLNLRCDPPIWAQAPGLLLLWISIFYIPATLDLKKYRVYAWIAVFPTRFGGAAFFFGAVLFFGQPIGFLSIAFVDLIIMLWWLSILLQIREIENPTSPAVKAYRSARRRAGWIVLAIIVLAVGVTAWYKLFREQDQQFASMDEYFKYGSIGTERAQGVPYWIWVVLPRLFPEYLPRPGGYNALGLYNEPGKPIPVGFSVKTIGFDRVGINCAICHSATIRLSASESPTLYLAGGTSTFDGLGYQRFLFASGSDPRFTADNILGEIDKIYKLSFIDRLIYRYALIPATKKAFIQQKQVYAWTESRPYWGPGRIDPFNPVKRNILNVDVGDTIGNSDMVPIWNLGARKKGWAFHWDGLNPNLVEVVRSSAIGDGAAPKDMTPRLKEQLQKLQDWLMQLKPPTYPSERFPVNGSLAASGKAIFDKQCSTCHDSNGARAGQVVPADEVGTDPHRFKIWTPEAAAAYNAYAKDYDWKFSDFRSTNGYVPPPLDAVWTRAPYLHNGSVPTLRDMLQKPDQRPKLFYRGYNVFEPHDVGFVWKGPEAERAGFRYDTSVPGNSNQGHLYGTDLSAADKDALLEFLKTQ